MIDGIPGPFERLVFRLVDRYASWLDSICEAPPGPQPRGPEVQRPVQPVPRGVPALIAQALESGKVDGLSQREIARRFNTSKSSVQRAQQLVREFADA